MMLFFALMCSPVMAAAQQPCTSDARPVVNELYRHMLERNADARSNYWVQQLQRGRTVRDLVREFAKSDEHVERFWRRESGETTPYLRAVGTLYRHILAVQPDAATARTFANQAARRGLDPVVDQIVDSADYTQRFGDWGVPGSGGLQYCGANNQAVTRNQGGNATGQTRFRGMDANNDGVISRTEWRGNRVAFDNQDWNRDGVLSEDELEPAASRGRGRGRQGNQINQENQAARRAERFANLDINDNGRIDPREWDGTVAAFNRLDANNDNVITRAEMLGRDADEQPAVATSGQSARTVRVEGRDRWTDTGITVRAGQILTMDARGTVRLGPNESDVAGVDGTLSGRRDSSAPIGNQPAGGLIARIGNSPIFYVGDRNSVRAPAAGRLYLGVNDNSLADNAGDFQVVVDVQP
jgi:hypothetical protein